MNFYKSAALALDHLEKHQGSVKGSLAAAGITVSGGEAKRILARKLPQLTWPCTDCLSRDRNLEMFVWALSLAYAMG